MKSFWNNNKEFRYFVWTVFNACVAFIVSQLSGLEGGDSAMLTGMLIPFLNIITKYVNTRYFKDLGVKK